MSLFDVQELARIPTKWREWVPQCANPSCHKQRLTHAITRRYSGVSISDEWFCGPDCFEEAARRKLVELVSFGRKPEKARALRMPLGLLLVSREVLSVEQLKVALDRQRETGANIGDVVQELGFATPEQVTAAVAAQWSCPVFSLRGRPLPFQVHIPHRLLELYEMLPVHFSETGRRLLIGFVSRVQHHILNTIEQMTSCVATPCFISAREYRQHLQSSLMTPAENEIVFDRISNAGEVARLARNYVKQLGAEEVRFGMACDYLWSRLRRGRQEMDLLFRWQFD
jgi:hypothetical protein